MEEKIETKEVEINWKGNNEKVELKELSFGERNQCLRESTEIDVMTGKGRITGIRIWILAVVTAGIGAFAYLYSKERLR